MLLKIISMGLLFQNFINAEPVEPVHTATIIDQEDTDIRLDGAISADLYIILLKEYYKNSPDYEKHEQDMLRLIRRASNIFPVLKDSKGREFFVITKYVNPEVALRYGITKDTPRRFDNLTQHLDNDTFTKLGQLHFAQEFYLCGCGAGALYIPSQFTVAIFKQEGFPSHLVIPEDYILTKDTGEKFYIFAHDKILAKHYGWQSEPHD